MKLVFPFYLDNDGKEENKVSNKGWKKIGSATLRSAPYAFETTASPSSRVQKQRSVPARPRDLMQHHGKQIPSEPT